MLKMTSKSNKSAKQFPEESKEQSEAETLIAAVHSANSLILEYKIKAMEHHFEKRYQELKHQTDKLTANIKNQEIADCLRKADEEWRFFIERIVCVIFALLAAIGKLFGVF